MELGELDVMIDHYTRTKIFVNGGNYESGAEVRMLREGKKYRVSLLPEQRTLYVFESNKIRNLRRRTCNFYLTLVYFDYIDSLKKLKVSVQFSDKRTACQV